jgi:hypothetical protein
MQVPVRLRSSAAADDLRSGQAFDSVAAATSLRMTEQFCVLVNTAWRTAVRYTRITNRAAFFAHLFVVQPFLDLRACRDLE